MKNFRVYLQENGFGYIDVEANNEEEACIIAMQRASGGSLVREEETYVYDIFESQTEEL